MKFYKLVMKMSVVQFVKLIYLANSFVNFFCFYRKILILVAFVSMDAIKEVYMYVCNHTRIPITYVQRTHKANGRS